MRFTRSLLTCLLSFCCFWPVCGQQKAATETSDQPENEKTSSQVRLDFFTAAAERYRVNLISEDGQQKHASSLVNSCLLRWTNPQQHVPDAAFFAYSQGGRPDVFVQFALYSPTRTIVEFQGVHRDSIQLVRDKRVIWEPKGLDREFRVLADTPSVSPKAVSRLTQMKRIADQFEFIDYHGWKDPVRMTLRRLTQPVHRYADESRNVVDGAVFVFAVATDPEVLLLLEAVEEAGTRSWQYGLVPMTIYKVEGSRNGKKIWDKPEMQIFCNSKADHYSCPHRIAPDAVSLKGHMPK